MQDMTRTLRYLFILLCLSITGTAFAQSAPGEITGTITDNKGEPVINATVQVLEGNIVKGGAVTDFDGKYSIKPIDPGHYDVKVSYLGFNDNLTTGVLVSPDKTTGVNVKLQPSATAIKEVEVHGYKIPLVDKYSQGGNTTITSDRIEKLPTRNTADIAATAPGVYQSKSGADLSLAGARTSGTLYIIDGVQVQGTAGTNLTSNSVDQIEVLTSGISAKYGDASGGVINITTKGVTPHYTGDVLIQHSVDGYNNNLAQASISGPIFSKKTKDGGKKPVMGFSVGGEVHNNHDADPSYNKEWVATGAEEKYLQQHPLHDTTDANGNHTLSYSSQYVTADKLTQVKVPPHDITNELRLHGKLDFQATENLSLTAGANFDYSKGDQYSRARNLFASEGTPVLNQITGRGFVRFTQRFGKNSFDSGKKSIISNAYYSIQGDYQKEYQSTEDPTFKSDIFKYQYVGKFNESYTPLYIYGRDTATNRYGILYQGDAVTGVSYDRSNLNPLLANYTSQYYNYLNGALPINTQMIQANGALLNGDLPYYTYGMFYNVGASQAYYRKVNDDQYALTVDASFDLQLGKTKHAIGFGLYYQQRIERGYVLQSNQNSGTQSLWQLMRQLVSNKANGKLSLDLNNPIYVINGKQYTKDDVNSGKVIPGPYDTIMYNYVNTNPTTFDVNLRKKLGVASNADINIDALDPSTFNLNMFSADELLNSGNPFATYQGYTYTGAKQSGNVSFNDFFTQKDANGNYTRPIAPYAPTYMAGYILDKFQFKDINFNVGVRIERFSANSKVLKDPYSLYAVKSVADNAASKTPAVNTINGGVTPSNIGSNYVVYVDDNTSLQPHVIGYRNGDKWYDATGKYLEDPKVLSESTAHDPQPLLVDNVKITDTNYNPNSSFTDYTPQVSVMPRISFSFPISDVAIFYAHYDIYTQHPYYGIAGTPYDYLYLQQNSNSIISNPNLKPQKTFDYEVGFTQKLSEQSALTLGAFYKERKNMITVVPYIDAYPTTYYTFGNRDFSTTKGLTLKYDLRRIKNFSMQLSYTLQFAEGTGSGEGSTNGGSTSYIAPYGILQDFIGAGLPNLRFISTLDYDSRHNIVADLDYRYGDGEGPVANGMHILQNAGISFLFKTRSGEPYTRYAVPDNVSHTVVGGVNGSRLPWHYDLDLRLDKDFALSFGKKHKEAVEGVKAKKPLYLNAFVYVTNLLNTRDILGVYGYTSRPDDNGYLTSPYGQQYVPQQVNPASYTDLYRISNNDPGHYNLPRQINIGLQFNF